MTTPVHRVPEHLVEDLQRLLDVARARLGAGDRVGCDDAIEGYLDLLLAHDEFERQRRAAARRAA